MVVVTKPLPVREKTAHDSVDGSGARRAPNAPVVLAMPGSLSHTAGLEASATGRAPAPRLALADAALARRPVVPDLVCRRPLARTLRDRPRLLRRPPPTPPPPGQDLCRAQRKGDIHAL